MPLERHLAWGSHYLSRKPAPVSDHPHNKEIFIIVCSEPPLAQLCVIPMCPVIS